MQSLTSTLGLNYITHMTRKMTDERQYIQSSLVERRVGGRQYGESGSVQQGSPNLEGRGVEGQRSQLQVNLIRSHDSEGIVDDQPHDAAVRHHRRLH